MNTRATPSVLKDNIKQMSWTFVGLGVTALAVAPLLGWKLAFGAAFCSLAWRASSR
jgi:hypothetical protein